MKELKDLKWLLINLTKAEKKVLFKLLKLTNEKGTDSKAIFLIQSLLNNQNYHVNDLNTILYKGSQLVALRKLIKRTYLRVQDVILLKYSIDSNTIYDLRTKEIFQLRKKLLQYDMLLSRGIQDTSIPELDKLIQKAEKYEYYDILLFILYKKRRLQLAASNYKSFQITNQKIEKNEMARKCLHKAEESFYTTCVLNFQSIKKEKSKSRYLESMINEIHEDVRITGSKTILYYLYMHQIEYFDLKMDYYSAYHTSEKLISFLHKESLVNTLTRMSTVLLNKANYLIKSFRFHDSELVLNNLDRRILKNKQDDLVIKEVLLSIAIFSNKQLLARECFTYILKLIESDDNYGIKKSKYYFIGLTISYLFGYSLKGSSNEDINTFSDFPDEKWKFSHRVFNILLLIEAEKYELADAQIENNRKYIERMKKSDVLNPRQSLIGKVLVELSRKSYDFKKVSKSKHKELTLLDSVEPEYRWQILSPEFIVFQEWFNAQLNHEKYDHGKVMERMKAKISPVVQKPLVTLKPDDGSKYNRRVPSGAKRKKLATA